MANLDEARAYLDKADKLLRWARAAQADLQKFGREESMDDVERSFA